MLKISLARARRALHDCAHRRFPSTCSTRTTARSPRSKSTSRRHRSSSNCLDVIRLDPRRFHSAPRSTPRIQLHSHQPRDKELATAADPKGPFTATTVNGDSKESSDRRYAESEDLGCALPRHSPRPARPAASPPIPCAAARSCLCPPCCERPRASDTNLAHTRFAGRGTAQRAAANRLHAYCAPATPDASPRHAPHSLCSAGRAPRGATWSTSMRARASRLSWL